MKAPPARKGENQMTRTYKIAEEIANEIVKVHNEKYEALKKRDIESFIKFANLEDNLKDSLVSLSVGIPSTIILPSHTS